MRFSKHSKPWTAATRAIFGDRGTATGAVAAEERNALLGYPGGDEAPMSVAEPMSKGDPTQHLLTALGRFQRQVSKADSGAPQSMWADECMNQLISGIELAAQEGWDGIQEALTDTARVLQSFEEPGKAHLCIPFLQDSYEILCLMVGDIIVDNVRSGVIQKWRSRYAQAIEELHHAGLSLIRDEDMEESEAPQEAAVEVDYAPETPVSEAAWTMEEDAETGPDVEADFEPQELPQDETEILLETYEESEAPEQMPANIVPFELPAEMAEPIAEPPAFPAPAEAPAPPRASWTEPEPAPAAPEMPAAETDSKQATLLRTTQEAMIRGNVADAKLYALQLAANMAQLEVEREEARLRELTAGRKEFDKAIASAQREVERTATGVEETERFLADSEAEFQAKREHAEVLRGRAAEVESRIAQIDAQLQELQARREEESQRLAAAHAELDEAVSLESRCQTELDGLADTEQAARESLDLARRNLGSLQADREEREADIAAAREELARRRQSAAEIERTIGLITGAPRTPESPAPAAAQAAAPAPAETGMLF